MVIVAPLTSFGTMLHLNKTMRNYGIPKLQIPQWNKACIDFLKCRKLDQQQ